MCLFVFPDPFACKTFRTIKMPSKLPMKAGTYEKLYVLIFQARSPADVLKVRMNGA